MMSDDTYLNEADARPFIDCFHRTLIDSADTWNAAADVDLVPTIEALHDLFPPLTPNPDSDIGLNSATPTPFNLDAFTTTQSILNESSYPLSDHAESVLPTTNNFSNSVYDQQGYNPPATYPVSQNYTASHESTASAIGFYPLDDAHAPALLNDPKNILSSDCSTISHGVSTDTYIGSKQSALSCACQPATEGTSSNVEVFSSVVSVSQLSHVLPSSEHVLSYAPSCDPLLPQTIVPVEPQSSIYQMPAVGRNSNTYQLSDSMNNNCVSTMQQPCFLRYPSNHSSAQCSIQSNIQVHQGSSLTYSQPSNVVQTSEHSYHSTPMQDQFQGGSVNLTRPVNVDHHASGPFHTTFATASSISSRVADAFLQAGASSLQNTTAPLQTSSVALQSSSNPVPQQMNINDYSICATNSSEISTVYNSHSTHITRYDQPGGPLVSYMSNNHREVVNALPQSFSQPTTNNNTFVPLQENLSVSIEEIRTFKCSKCSFVDEDRQKVVRHTRVHAGDARFPGKQFIMSKQQPSAHRILPVVLHKSSRNPSGSGNNTPQVRRFLCSMCPDTFEALDKCCLHINHVHKLKTKKVLLQWVVQPTKKRKKVDGSSSQTSMKRKSSLQQRSGGRTTNNQQEFVSQRNEMQHTPVQNRRHFQSSVTKEHGMFMCEHKACNQRFRRIESLEYHQRCHGNEGSFICFECPDSFRSSDGDQVEFKRWRNLATHLWRQHGIDMELHSCNICGFKTYSLSNLENLHKPTHGEMRAFSCPKCPRRFKSIKQMRNHVLLVHKPRPPVAGVSYSCSECGVAFARRTNLKEHLIVVHRTASITCSICSWIAPTMKALTKHRKAHRTGTEYYSESGQRLEERPLHRCTLCNFSCVDSSSLRRHQQTHSTEKLYSCLFCSYSTAQTCSLKRHALRKHGPESVDKLFFRCDSCNFKSFQKKLLEDHRSKRHGVAATR